MPRRQRSASSSTTRSARSPRPRRTTSARSIRTSAARCASRSARPDLSGGKLQEYEDALDEEAFPFEEKAIKVHEKNLELMSGDRLSQQLDREEPRASRRADARPLCEGGDQLRLPRIDRPLRVSLAGRGSGGSCRGSARAAQAHGTALHRVEGPMRRRSAERLLIARAGACAAPRVRARRRRSPSDKPACEGGQGLRRRCASRSSRTKAASRSSRKCASATTFTPTTTTRCASSSRSSTSRASHRC